MAAPARPVAVRICSRVGARRTLRIPGVVDVVIDGPVSSVFDCPRYGIILSEVGVRVGVTRSVVGSTSAPGAAMKRHVRTTRTCGVADLHTNRPDPVLSHRSDVA